METMNLRKHHANFYKDFFFKKFFLLIVLFMYVLLVVAQSNVCQSEKDTKSLSVYADRTYKYPLLTITSEIQNKWREMKMISFSLDRVLVEMESIDKDRVRGWIDVQEYIELPLSGCSTSICEKQNLLDAVTDNCLLQEAFIYGRDYVFRMFADSITEKPFIVIHDNQDEEEWTTFTILDKSENRFFVSVDTYPTIKRLRGWVKREDCAVYLWPRNDEYAYTTNASIELYDRPGACFASLVLTDDLMSYNTEVRLLDIKEGWLHVQCSLPDGNRRNYWIKDFCGSILGCEGR